MHHSSHDSSAPLRLLDAYVRRSRWRSFLSRLTDALALLVVGCTLVGFIHRWIGLPSLLREIAFDAMLVFALIRILPSIARLLQPDLDRIGAAERIERRYPVLAQRLSTWASCVQRGETGPWVEELRVAANLLPPDMKTCLAQCLPWSSVIWRGIGACGLIALATVLMHVCGIRVGPSLPPWPR